VTAPHRYRSALLGEGELVQLAQGAIEAFSRGSGPVLGFAHG
jgi:hypothetical protein